MEKEELFDKLKKLFPGLSVDNYEEAKKISGWISSSESIDLTNTLVFDTPKWSSEIIYMGNSCFVSVRHKDKYWRRMCNFRVEDNSVIDKIYKFMKKDYIVLDEKRFDGDIVITDPCYTHEEHWEDPDVDIDSGEGFDKYYGDTYIYEDTIYGDWGCTTYDIGEEDPSDFLDKPENPGIPIGKFCADAGLVCVVYLSKCSDEFRNNSNSWTRTIIRDFHGIIKCVISNDEVHIIGYSDDGKHNFITYQTSI